MSRIIVLNDIINFEPEKKSLYSSDSHVQISAPASYCLQLLIEKQGELVSHDEFYEYAWRQFGMEATANTLYQNISLIRRGLNSCGLHLDVIRTMPRRGFILSPAVKICQKRACDHSSEIDLVEGDSSDIIRMNRKESLLLKNADNDKVDVFNLFKDNASKLDIAPKVKKNEDLGSSEKSKTGKSKCIVLPQLNNSLLCSLRNDKLLVNGVLSGLVIMALVSVIYLVVYINLNQHLKSINYVYFKSEYGCDYFVNRDGEDSQRLIIFLSTIKKQCFFGKYIYLTRYTDGGFVSIINCNKPLSYLDGPLCVSEYLNEDNGGEDE